jgi:hypothetical protein
MPRALARPLLRVVAGLAVSLATLTGCSDEPAPTSTSPSQSSGPTTGRSPTTGPSPSTSSRTPGDPPSSPSTSPSSSVGSSGRSLDSRLLGASRLPGFNTEFRWAQGPTGPEDPSTSFGTCQRFAVTSIGAEQALVRRFRPSGPGSAESRDRAGELVATFPDDATARRAFAVLSAWRRQCADRLRSFPRSTVGALQDVAVEGGTGGWYLLTYGPVRGHPDSQFFDAQGMAVVGSRIAMVSMVLAGQDYGYEPGQEPMVAAVQRAARLLS